MIQVLLAPLLACSHTPAGSNPSHKDAFLGRLTVTVHTSTGPPRTECDYMFFTCFWKKSGLTMFNMFDRKSQAMAAALCVKAATEFLARRRTPCWNIRQWAVTPPWEPWKAPIAPWEETKVGGRLDTDPPLISWMVRHRCWLHCRVWCTRRPVLARRARDTY